MSDTLAVARWLTRSLAVAVRYEAVQAPQQVVSHTTTKPEPLVVVAVA
jgi:hypothetical protein